MCSFSSWDKFALLKKKIKRKKAGLPNEPIRPLIHCYIRAAVDGWSCILREEEAAFNRPHNAKTSTAITPRGRFGILHSTQRTKPPGGCDVLVTSSLASYWSSFQLCAAGFRFTALNTVGQEQKWRTGCCDNQMSHWTLETWQPQFVCACACACVVSNPHSQVQRGESNRDAVSCAFSRMTCCVFANYPTVFLTDGMMNHINSVWILWTVACD